MPMTDIPILVDAPYPDALASGPATPAGGKRRQLDTPNFRARELKELKFDGTAAPGALKLADDQCGTCRYRSVASQFQTTRANHIETASGRQQL